jgi:hypothetical protein
MNQLLDGTRVRTEFGRVGTVTGRSIYGTALVHFDDDDLPYGGQEWPDDRLIVIPDKPSVYCDPDAPLV